MMDGWHRVGRWLVVAVVMAVALSTPAVSAKGGPSLTAVAVRAAEWDRPRRVALHLPDEYDEMVEVLDAEWRTADQPIAHRSDVAIGERLPYAITLHYDFVRTGHGARDWEGRFDGDRTLYFPSGMVVGNGVWQAGWYQASPLLTDALRQATDETQAPVAWLPRTDLRADTAVAARTMLAALALVTLFAALAAPPLTRRWLRQLRRKVN